MEECRMVFVTVPTREEGEELAEALLEKKLAACVSLLQGLDSRYWWEGKVARSQECLLLLKTRSSLEEELIATVKARHSYSVPEIVFLPILSGNPDYLSWIVEMTGSSEGK